MGWGGDGGGGRREEGFNHFPKVRDRAESAVTCISEQNNGGGGGIFLFQTAQRQIMASGNFSLPDSTARNVNDSQQLRTVSTKGL
jgi:hypothetical protein